MANGGGGGGSFKIGFTVNYLRLALNKFLYLCHTDRMLKLKISIRLHGLQQHSPDNQLYM